MKRKREFNIYRDGLCVASGVLYDEGNVQVLWRRDIGFTAEQYASVRSVMDIMPGCDTLCYEPGHATLEDFE